MRDSLRSISVSIIATCVLLVDLAVAQAQPVRHYAFPAQPLGVSLRQLGTQSELNVLFDGSRIERIGAPAIDAKSTADQVLTMLLRDSGYTHQYLNEHTVVLSAENSGSFKRAHSEFPSPSEGEGKGEDRSKHAGVAADGSQTQEVSLPETSRTQSSDDREMDATASKEVAVTEIVVTGSQIRGVENITAPVLVLERSYIESTGLNTVTRLIESLPQNFALANQSGVNVPGVSNPQVQGSSINLRGIGEGTTLTLINGRRMAPGFFGSAVDISSIPLSAIERVEVLTDGASALYGSDAVGGVVNFILKDDFNGAETSVHAGRSAGEVDEFRVNQIFGKAWSSGRSLLSAEYYRRDLLSTNQRDFIPQTSIVGSLLPEDENRALMFSAKQAVSDHINFFADGLYTKRDSRNEGGDITVHSENIIGNPQSTATFGGEWSLGKSWNIELSGTHAKNSLDLNFSGSGPSNSGLARSAFTSNAGRIKADGAVFALSGDDVKAAFGADWRSEKFKASSELDDGSSAPAKHAGQIVRSLFGELFIPVVGSSNARTGVQSLALSIAGRFDDYSSFGTSFDPRYGLMWQPLKSVRLRASYGTSYVAPRLFDYNLNGNAALAVTFPDAAAPAGVSKQLLVFGTDVAGLAAQRSESSTFGIEFLPSRIGGLHATLNYYTINYRDRIADPPFATVMLANEGNFADLVYRNPTVNQVNSFIQIGQFGQGFSAYDPAFNPDKNFDPASVRVIVDGRRRNLSSLRTNGIDGSVNYELDSKVGKFNAGLSGTYIFNIGQRITATSSTFDSVGTFYNPPHTRWRTSLGWQLGGLSASTFVNKTGSYSDNRSNSTSPVKSFVTVDAHVEFNFGHSSKSDFLSGIVFSMNGQNILDKDPPRTAILPSSFDLGFDPTNASPLGRLISAEVRKTW